MSKRIETEKRTLGRMIRLYCRHREGNRALCGECLALRDYALLRLDKCPFGEKKTACRDCPVHCYAPEAREKIRQVMRFSGPRMIVFHPGAALRHLFSRK